MKVLQIRIRGRFSEDSYQVMVQSELPELNKPDSSEKPPIFHRGLERIAGQK